MDFLNKLLLQLPPEASHHLALKLLKLYPYIRFPSIRCLDDSHPVEALSLRFPNPIGLGAGFDKDGQIIEALGLMGFGFIEVGTVTPLPQIGNPKPRIFRLKRDSALVNRMGFNNQGAEALVKRLQKRRYSGVLGVNIGKNKSTPLDKAHLDYSFALQAVYPYCDYICLNFSSPNTPDLRALQTSDHLSDLLKRIKEAESNLIASGQKRKPIVVKVAPDLTESEVDFISQTLLDLKIDGLNVSNTTLARPEMLQSELPLCQQNGGLSGEPLLTLSNQRLRDFHQRLGNKVTLIGTGGVLSADDYQSKRQAGADLVQVYTGFIYRGLRLLKEINAYLIQERLIKSKH